MGLFLSMSGVVAGNEDDVLNALRAYAEDREGLLEEAALTVEDKGCLVISEGVGGTTILYPVDFFDWDSAADYLSQRLGKPVFSFHVHDGDLWMYALYENGRVVDQFNPLPDYWQELGEQERCAWQGNAFEVAKRVPGLKLNQISNYLIQWGGEILESGQRKKAYPTDQFYYGSEWQLVDFMGKLGLGYPIDDRGAAHGATYRFQCETE
jgi:hypothetical protein